MNADIYGDERRASPAGPMLRRLDSFGEGAPARGLLWALLFGCLFMLGMELRDVVEVFRQPPTAVTVEPTVVHRQLTPKSADPRPVPRIKRTGLAQPIAFTAGAGGILLATGTIDEGAAGRLEAELKAYGDEVRTLSLDSPGGSLDEAMQMARIIRRHGLATEVADGALCASSCPLLFAGGVERSVDAGASIGVHQFYASTDLSADPAEVMVDAQLTTARIARHLTDMGVDPALWFNALATPPQSLYYLSRRELADYRLVTVPLPMAGNTDAPPA